MKSLAFRLLPALLCLPLLVRAAPLSVGGLKFSAPDEWKTIPPSSPMRAGTLSIPVAGLEKPLEAVFFYFGPGQGGDAEANVARWFKQFEGEPVTQREEVAAGGQKVILVKAVGTYLDGMPMGPKTPRANHTLLGAIVPGPDAQVFIRLTGPQAAVADLEKAFRQLALSPFPNP